MSDGGERQVEGIVEAQLPSGLYRVGIDGSRQITAHAGGGLERNFIRLLVGDRVVVELTPRDLTRGRILNFSRLSPKQRIDLPFAFFLTTRPVYFQLTVTLSRKSRLPRIRPSSSNATNAIIPSRPRGAGFRGWFRGASFID